jgi:hypothetical protein
MQMQNLMPRTLATRPALAAVPRRLFRFIGWLVLREEEEAGALQRTVVAAVDPV